MVKRIFHLKQARGSTAVCLLLLISALGAGIAASATSPWPFKSNTAPPQPTNVNGLTVAFWNIQWFPGMRPDTTQDAEMRQTNAVHSEISRINPDIIGMEEVRDWKAAALAVEPLKGMKVDVCANFPPREGQAYAQEVAIASRLQPISAWVETWKPAGAATPPRGFAFTAYEVQPKKLLLVYCVHFKSNRDGATENIPVREESTRQLLSHIEAMKRAYSKMGQVSWIIGGDFNTSLEDPQFAAEKTLRSLTTTGFSWVWQNIAPGTRMTLQGDKNYPPTCFDHIFYQGLTLRHAQVISTTRQSSDHKPVVATFDL
ncbi:MAG TPA: endonuclease/exonuclease/phosphatase family protein [Chthoniobacterales bacterium]|jgi:endonuclease/exonuclease/phosphatase (EEP) superfamily protein YafD